MRRSKHVLLLAAAGALIAATVAVGAKIERPKTSDVSAAFTAAQTRANSHTCTEAGNTFRVTNAVWKGTSTSSEPRLAGNLVIKTHAVLNETTGDGWVSGTWRSRNPGLGSASAHLSAVIDNQNHLDGLANGDARAPHDRLLGNWSATIVAQTLSGELGANAPVAPDNSALLYRGGCRNGD
jgi:hypothetical protein